MLFPYPFYSLDDRANTEGVRLRDLQTPKQLEVGQNGDH